MSAQRIVVVGGGIAGLGTAALLADRGHDVQLFEARDALGGRAGSWEADGFRFDTGPSWYLMPEVFDHFFRLLGTSADEQLDLVRLDPAYRVFGPPGKGEPIDIVSGREAARALWEKHEPGSGDKLLAYLDSAKDAYELSTSKFLYDPYSSTKGLRDPSLVKRLPTLIPLLTRSLWKRITSDFHNPRLQQILAYPAVFLGGSPFEVPSLYHLMSHLDLGDGVLYPRGGMTEIIKAIERLARERGVQIEASSPVEAIITEAGTARGVRLADGRVIAADAVVSGADLHHTENHLLEEKDRQYPEKWWDDKVPSPGALLLLLGVKGELPQLTHHTLLFTDDWHTNFDNIFGENKRIPDPASIYICRPSATDDSVAPEGHENLFVLVPVPADPDSGRGGVSGAGDDRIEKAADRVIAQIGEWIGIPDFAERIVVRRTIAPEDFKEDLHAWHGNSLGLAHTLNQSAIFRPKNRSRKVDNLYYAGTSVLPGIGLPMCLISAELVVKRMTGDKTPGPLAEPARAAV
ncbi:phytoene desaturase family protein [Microbacterium sp. PRF11]|uniref:phytoene desaturase family protein n=1 Tax=Microbacterium sp. PRF11 TaxID=2962593 RepID=UPI002881CB6D|nr:phytoene desaturase family protein [Microbacterium sp. PRF11]MDT0117717.1 phytoene desaturase family protein [Microbacterium sp. PRF11]